MIIFGYKKYFRIMNSWSNHRADHDLAWVEYDFTKENVLPG